MENKFDGHQAKKMVNIDDLTDFLILGGGLLE